MILRAMPVWLVALLIVAVIALGGLGWLVFVMRSRVSPTSICILSEEPFRPTEALRARLVRDVFSGEARVGESTTEFEGFAIEFSDVTDERRDPPPVGVRGPSLASAKTLFFWGFAAGGVTVEVTRKMDEALARTAGWFMKQPTVIGMIRSAADGAELLPRSPELIARLDSGRLDELPGRIPGEDQAS
jgi:hypothetical protein